MQLIDQFFGTVNIKFPFITTAGTTYIGAHEIMVTIIALPSGPTTPSLVIFD